MLALLLSCGDPRKEKNQLSPTVPFLLFNLLMAVALA